MGLQEKRASCRINGKAEEETDEGTNVLRMSFHTLILQGIPECVAINAVIFALLGLRLNWHLIVPLGLTLGVAAYLVRMLPIPFGVHTFILMFVEMGLARLVTGQDLGRVVRAVLIVNIVIPVTELLGTGLLLRLFQVTYADVAHKWYWPFLGWPHVVVLYILAFVLDRRNRRRREELGHAADEPDRRNR